MGQVSLPVILLHHLLTSIARQENCVSTCALPCVTLPTDTDIHTIGEKLDQCALLAWSAEKSPSPPPIQNRA
jgi:hypothetical protein